MMRKKVIPTEDGNTGSIEVELLEREDWGQGTEGDILETGEEVKV